MKNRRIATVAILLCLITLFCFLAAPANAIEKKSVELVDLRTATSKTFLNPDGAYEYVGYASRIHYKAPDGKFSEISHKLVKNAGRNEVGDYDFVNEANDFSLFFGDYLPSDANRGNEAAENSREDIKGYPVSIRYEDAFIAMRPFEGKPAKAEMPTEYFSKSILSSQITGGDYIVYQDIYPGIDIAYISICNGLKENIVINEPTEQNEFLFELYTRNVQFVENESGQCAFIYNDETIFCIGDLFAIDQAGTSSSDVKCTYYENETGKFLKLTVDERFLQDPARVYPIIVDPSIVISSASTLDTFVAQANPNTNYNSGTNIQYLRTGKDSPYGVRRTLIKFDIPSSVKGVTSAYLKMRVNSGVSPNTVYAYRATASWASSSATLCMVG